MARFSNPFSQYFSDSGRILPGAQLFFYVNGTTTPQATYADAAFTVVNPNPVICGTNGRVPDIFMPGNLVYSITLTDTNGVQIDQADDITGSDSRVSSSDVIDALAANTDPVVINGSSATINADTTIDGALEVLSAVTALGGGSNPALSGAIRMPNNQSIRARDNANSADIFMIGTNTADTLLVGADTDIGFIQLGTTSGPDTVIRGDLNMTLGGNARMANGNGIDFSAAGGDVLANYSTITPWTPVIADASSGGNTGTATIDASYVRVGALVFINVALLNINTAGMTPGNILYIRNLPFDADSTGGTTNFFISADISFQNININGTAQKVAASIAENSSFFSFFETVSNSTPSTITVADLSSGVSDIYLSFTYLTDAA